MPTARDWIKTLWAASYKGYPFYYERDEIEFGNDIVVHEFPNSDQNYNEDMGESARSYTGNAYVTGDDADAQAIGFLAALVSHGPGILVLPTDGPILVRAQHPCKRVAEKDRFGYICFEVRFVREGVAAALVSVPYLQQRGYDAANAANAAIVAAAPALLTTANQPDIVIAATVDEVQAVAGAIDAVRVSYPVTAAAAQAVSGNLQAIVDNAAALLDPAGAAAGTVSDFAAVVGLSPAPTDAVKAIAGAIVLTLSDLRAGLASPDLAQDALAVLAQSFAAPPVPVSPPYSPSDATAQGNVAGVLQLGRLAALAAWAKAVLARSYTDRPAAVTARAEAAERFERELNHCPGARFAALYLAIEALQASVVSYLTQLMADLAPVVEVEAPIMLPSLVAAWSLYQDPVRAVDLVLRNRVKHPSFMPREFEALAPGYAAPASLPTVWPAPPL
jgi:prophage DNA circulation protein